MIERHLHLDRAKQVGGVGESCTGDRLSNVSMRGVKRKDTYTILITVWVHVVSWIGVVR